MKLGLILLSLFSLASALATIEKVEIKLLDPTKGKFSVKINPGPPKSVDIDAESFVEGKDISIKFAAFSLIDGHYNEFIESETVSVCDLPKSEHPLVAFIYQEMLKSGNMTTACPVKKLAYVLHGFTIEESEMPVPVPPGSFKIELNGTIHEHDKDTPLFVSDIYFIEA